MFDRIRIFYLGISITRGWNLDKLSKVGRGFYQTDISIQQLVVKIKDYYNLVNTFFVHSLQKCVVPC
ncbi:unnamed protein product [Moneuplotes crassus]|uniref:Uncharacterized protein n=1 Tax=Euplotes crassus TaxID=5936 RepID=A0AAD1UQJ0_EUPCR|nr:unnamed protein product [Moneuplotes crassus]